MKLYTRQYSENGPAVIILHGLFGNQGNWAWHARELSAEYAVYAMDLRNHGRSGWSREHDYRVMAEDVLETMTDLGLEVAHVIGHSMGGKVAMQLALMAPDKVEKLVVVDIAPVAYENESFTPLEAMQAVPLDTITSREEADAALAEYIDTDAIRDFLLTNLQRDEQGRFQWRCNLEVIAEHFDSIRGALPAQGHFDGSTLVIKGSLSPYVQEKHRDDIERLFPDVSLKIIDSAGHWVHSEKPRAFLKIIRAFLAQ